MIMVAAQTNTTLDDVIDILIAASEKHQEAEGTDNQSLLDYLWALLHEAKLTVIQFVKLIEVMAHLSDYDSLLIEAINLALSHDAVEIARQLILRGQQLDPDNETLQKLAHITAPPKPLSADRPPRRDLAASMNWLRQHSADYAGNWVALENGTLLGSAHSRPMLLEQLGNPTDTANILITWIP